MVEALERSLQQALESLVPPNVRVLLAVSGGCDSVALFHAWLRIWPDAAVRLHIAHFDHRTREGSADDAAWVQSLAADYGLSCEVGVWDRPIEKKASEGSARQARYRFLAEVAERCGASCIAVAHSADDQVETIMHAILRGAGIHGLAGMRSKRKLQAFDLVRPLLHENRVALRDYLLQREKTWREDPTNAAPVYLRNRIRNSLLPILEAQFNPQVRGALLRVGDQARGAAEFLDESADALMGRAGILIEDRCIKIPLAEVGGLSRFERCNLFRRIFERAGWPRGRMGAAEWERLSAFIEGDAIGMELPQGVRARRISGSLMLERKSAC